VRTTLYPLLDALAAEVELRGPFVEFGGRLADEQAHLRPVRSCFAGRPWFTSDIQRGAQIDQVQDLHRLGVRDGSIGTALVLEVVEHLRRPWDAMAEVHRCLAPGGLAIVSTVFFFPVHGHPDDYWRFTGSGMATILEQFDRVEARTAGHPALPHTVVGLAAKAPFDDARWDAAVRCIDRWQPRQSTSWKERALMALPPRLLVAGYAGFRSVGIARNRSRLR
jgi:SAM-dependent methyltransferase